MTSCFTCLNCGRVNPVKGHSYTNKYCNNSCQQQHRSRLLVTEWKENQDKVAYKQAPEWMKKYLINERGHVCQICESLTHNGKNIPLTIDYKDNNTHNYTEDNLILICPNCKAQR